MVNDLVSIVIPMYNSESTIERCVESIVSGTYQNIEVIVIDDCSKDNSYIVAKALEDKYPQVVCLRNEKNSGVSATRNKGLDYAHGTYLMFTDSDDWVKEDFISLMVNCACETAMPVCGYENHDELKNDKMEVFGWTNEAENKKASLSNGLLELYNGRLLQMIWNKVFLLKVVKENNIRFDTSIHCGEDFRFLLDYLKLSKITEFIFLNKTLYGYSRDNADSLATRFTEIALEEPLINLRKMYKLAGKSDEEIEVLMIKERQSQLGAYAYGYMHDDKLSGKEKKQKILALPFEDSKKAYRFQKKLYIKEKIRKRIPR